MFVCLSFFHLTTASFNYFLVCLQRERLILGHPINDRQILPRYAPSQLSYNRLGLQHLERILAIDEWAVYKLSWEILGRVDCIEIIPGQKLTDQSRVNDYITRILCGQVGYTIKNDLGRPTVVIIYRETKFRFEEAHWSARMRPDEGGAENVILAFDVDVRGEQSRRSFWWPLASYIEKLGASIWTGCPSPSVIKDVPIGTRKRIAVDLSHLRVNGKPWHESPMCVELLCPVNVWGGSDQHELYWTRMRKFGRPRALSDVSPSDNEYATYCVRK